MIGSTFSCKCPFRTATLAVPRSKSQCGRPRRRLVCENRRKPQSMVYKIIRSAKAGFVIGRTIWPVGNCLLTIDIIAAVWYDLVKNQRIYCFLLHLPFANSRFSFLFCVLYSQDLSTMNRQKHAPTADQLAADKHILHTDTVPLR